MNKIAIKSIKNIVVPIVLVLVFIFTSQYSFAQEDDNKSNPFSFAVGFNVSDPILSALKNPANIDSFKLVPPNLYANLGFKNMHLRIGFGGDLGRKNNRSDLANNVSESVNYKYALSTSLLYRKVVSTKISAYAGLFFWTQYYLNETTYDSGFDLTTQYNEYIAYAGGPGMVLEYHLGKKISIFTEYCVMYRIDKQNIGRTFSAFPAESYKKHSATVNSLSFQHPISIFLNYKF